MRVRYCVEQTELTVVEQSGFYIGELTGFLG